MKKLVVVSIVMLFAQFSQSQTITDLQAYYKFDGTRIVTLLSNSTIWWFTEDKGWQQLPQDGLTGKVVTKIGVYIKTGVGSGDTRLIAVTSDNQFFWYTEGKPWELIKTEGLPDGYSVKIFTPYFKPSGLGFSGHTRYFLAQNDNSMWWFNEEKWEKLSAEGLPSNYDLKFMKTYQKYGMMGGNETRYISVLNDNTIWWSAGKKWEKVATKGLTEGKAVTQFDVYMKFPLMGMPEGRLVAVLSDESFWFMAVNNKNWQSLESTGLPAKYKVKYLKVFQKWGSSESGRIVVTLEDDSIWWFAEGKGWTKINTAGLKLSK